MQGSPVARLAAAIYPVLLALMAGGILIDQIHAHAAPVGDSPAGHAVADALLLLSLPVIAFGVTAAVLGTGRARLLIAFSLGMFALEFLLPPLVKLLPGGALLAPVGPQLRATAVVAALLLAMLALLPTRGERQ
jgi:hypothetical protein